MMNTILTSFQNHPSLQLLDEALKRGDKPLVHGLGGSSSAFLVARMFNGIDIPRKRSILVVFPNNGEAETFRDDIETVLGADFVKFFPERDTNPYERADSHFEVRSQRVEALNMLSEGMQGVIVASIGALHDSTTPPGIIGLISINIHVGETFSFEDLVRSLTAVGFKRRNTVTSAGEIAVRGGIIDVYPFGGEYPYRLEFWGDEIESIRTFSTSTQRSLKKVNSLKVLPPDEFVTEAGFGDYENDRLKKIESENGISLDFIRDAFETGERAEGIEQYLHAVFGPQSNLTAHFNKTDLAFVFDWDRCVHEIETRLERSLTIWDRQRHEDPNIVHPDFFCSSVEDVKSGLESIATVYNYYLNPPTTDIIEFSITSSRQYQGNLTELTNDIEKSRKNGLICHILCDNKGQVERLDDLLDRVNGDYSISVSRLSGGFTDPASNQIIFTDHEIFSRYRQKIRYRRYKDGLPIQNHNMLSLGDFVVHVDYGIGRYKGLKRVEIGGAETDCLLIYYRDEDQLLLPIGKLDRLKRFTSEEGVLPIVSKLGGSAWDKLKARTKKSIQTMSDELVRLYAKRKAFSGFSFRADDHMMQAIIDSFIYDETEDQRRSWEAVKADMESSSPMERLICGDVGFGKTEVAMRAAFLAALNGKQVAVLVPTTILADQHEETFMERFADFPVTVASVSRFRTKAEQKVILDKLSRGEIDIIIGTHRLLSKDVYFKNLGLLIVDEEQRFGVSHKEKLKKLRTNVDVLSMSATPIPRTLNMSLLGARDISYINTPPRDRYSVHTEIHPFNDKTVIEAIMREIDREGQVYFVHNRVESIYTMESYLKKLLPSVSIVVAHGQLSEKRLENVMHEFHHGKYQVLLSTVIIENGLDIPSVNTIIINRADTFGLSQLYQLRGRVGRSNRRAYAYLMIPPKSVLSKIARERLRTIEEFASLGSGINIAMRDLEIRGAGNILGTKQSGYISAIGFDLYMEILYETIAELKGEVLIKPPEIEINTKRDAFIPDTYIQDSRDRVLFYQRLSEALSASEVQEVEDELIDRFGRPDEPLRNLLDITYMRHYAVAIGAKVVTVNDATAKIFIPDNVDVTRDKVEEMIKKSTVNLQFSFNEGMSVTFSLTTRKNDRLGEAKNVLRSICT